MAKEQHLSFVRYIAHQTYRFAFHKTYIVSNVQEKLKNALTLDLNCDKLFHFHSCHVTLHVSECPERAVQCTVSGCKTIMKRKHVQEHIMTAAYTHAVLQAGEVQRLRGVMHFKV